MSYAKPAEPIEMPFESWAQMGPGNHVLDEVHIPLWGGVILRGKGRPTIKYRDALP